MNDLPGLALSSTGLHPFNREAHDLIAEALRRRAEDAERAAHLRQLNESRTQALRNVVHRAADHVLRGDVRASNPRDAWPQLVRAHLQHHHQSLGRDRCPSWNTVRIHLETWEPPKYQRRLVSFMGREEPDGSE
jgi:hypothetical protein